MPTSPHMQQKRLLGKPFGVRLRAVPSLQLRASNSGELSPRHHIVPRLQQLAPTIDGVMAWPERANATAHARKATHCKSLRYQAASRGCSPTASVQFRRALPVPSHRTALMTTFSISLVHVCTLPSSFRWRGRHGPQITCAKAHLSSGT